MKSEKKTNNILIHRKYIALLMLKIMRRLARYPFLATGTLSKAFTGHLIDLLSHAVITQALPCWSNQSEACPWKPLSYCTPEGITLDTTAQFSGGTDTLCRTLSLEGLTSA